MTQIEESIETDQQRDTDVRDLLHLTTEEAARWFESLPDRRVGPTASREEMLRRFGGELPDQGESSESVIRSLVRGAEGGLSASPGSRYFGFVIGATLPVAVAADWLTVAWDQNAGLFAISPAASVVEEVAAGWLLDLFGLPKTASMGFVTGCQMANFTALAAARHAVLLRAGWDVSLDGLQGAPPVTIVTSAESHVTIFSALRYLGFSTRGVRRVESDGEGRMVAEGLRREIADVEGPLIVCAQAGNVNSGAFDPLEDIAAITHAKDGWLHVDGAFGLWAAANHELQHMVKGIEQADSWATDAHKWLNVPQDSGIVIVADSSAHRAATSVTASYLIQTEGAERDPFEWVPEFSRRARGFAVWAALRHLGRKGISALIGRSCARARQLADRLRAEPGVQILNDVVLNQVLVRFEPPAGGDADVFTREVVTRVQKDGTCWLSGTTWHDVAAMRFSVSGWSTSEDDIERTADAIIRAMQG